MPVDVQRVTTRPVTIKAIESVIDRHRFVALPFRLYADDPTWIPPLRLSVLDRISPKHPANATQDTRLWMAYRGREPVGRIGACIDRAFDELHGEQWCWVGIEHDIGIQASYQPNLRMVPEHKQARRRGRAGSGGFPCDRA